MKLSSELSLGLVLRGLFWYGSQRVLDTLLFTHNETGLLKIPLNNVSLFMVYDVVRPYGAHKHVTEISVRTPNRGAEGIDVLSKVRIGLLSGRCLRFGRTSKTNI